MPLQSRCVSRSMFLSSNAARLCLLQWFFGVITPLLQASKMFWSRGSTSLSARTPSWSTTLQVSMHPWWVLRKFEVNWHQKRVAILNLNKFDAMFKKKCCVGGDKAGKIFLFLFSEYWEIFLQDGVLALDTNVLLQKKSTCNILIPYTCE